jgi:hypothetical protein
MYPHLEKSTKERIFGQFLPGIFSRLFPGQSGF